MTWMNWLRTMCPVEWKDEQALEFVNIECPEVTLKRLQKERYALSA